MDFPDWVQEYLAACAQRMLSPQAANDTDLRKILPRIMGFPAKRGRGNLLNPDGDTWLYLDAAAKFAREIATGAKPKAALRSAFEVLDPEFADIDDKTLISHIKKNFEMQHTPTPRTNAEWKRAISSWAVSAIGPLVKRYREISPPD